jgi:HMG (high mobility group) box
VFVANWNSLAFILYRQNRHSDILAQHPNLPNPEISKIAGQLWANEPDRVKEEWKRLAAVSDESRGLDSCC